MIDYLLKAEEQYFNKNIYQALELLECNLTKVPNDKESLLFLADIYLETDQFKRAIKIYRKCLKLGFKSDELYSSLGYTLMELGDYKGAEKILKIGLRHFPFDDYIICNYTNVLMEFKDFITARELMEKAVEFGSDYYMIYNNLGYLNFLENKHGHALKNYKQSLSLKEDNPIALFNRGVLLFEKLNQKHNGLKDIRKAQSLGSLDAYLYLTKLLYQ